MRLALLIPLCPFFLFASSTAWAQTPAPSPDTPPALPSTNMPETRTQRVDLEDAGAKIEEIRVGGETKTIEVTPKGGMPAYQVAPTTGERSWKILGF